MKIYILVGTRPNFIKVTRFRKVAASLGKNIQLQLIHTGQHSDHRMSTQFFDQFRLFPDHYLDVSAGNPGMQIGEIMVKLDQLIQKIGKPDFMLVPGDVNSTLAGAIYANKCGIRLGHIEAGLRSFDRSMPEEFNRKLTDELSDLFFVTEESGSRNLVHEGHPASRIHFVGNTMIDTMLEFEPQIQSAEILSKLGVEESGFVLMTMHRPSNVDSKESLTKVLDVCDYLARSYQIVFPIHPRTMDRVRGVGLQARLEGNKKLHCVEPLDYFSFQKLVKTCAFIVTDSGGIQEESTWRGKPCLTLRENTERPVTVDEGTNTLLPFDTDLLSRAISDIETGRYKKGKVPTLWDGKATERIMEAILNA
jgi:UDP-N-acetylglucosamine 2-epimerase (non-hydrolysing)